MFEMMSFRTGLIVNVRTALAAVLLLPLLSACAKTDVPVSIHGVNYSGEIFRYFIVDPNDKKNNGGGETIDPYGAGGTMCCFSLPEKWRPGIKVQINATHRQRKQAGVRMPEVSETQIVEVPAYANGKPGELWVLRGENGELSVISSDYQPDHVKWPGKIKGWPVPSLEYQRERWQVYMDHEQMYVDFYEKMLAELRDTPEKRAKDAWEYAKKNDPKSISSYSGPEDARYREVLKIHYMSSLADSKKKVAQLQKERP